MFIRTLARLFAFQPSPIPLRDRDSGAVNEYRLNELGRLADERDEWRDKFYALMAEYNTFSATIMDESDALRKANQALRTENDELHDRVIALAREKEVLDLLLSHAETNPLPVPEKQFKKPGTRTSRKRIPPIVDAGE